jgi:hypothetical protein
LGTCKFSNKFKIAFFIIVVQMNVKVLGLKS